MSIKYCSLNCFSNFRFLKIWKMWLINQEYYPLNFDSDISPCYIFPSVTFLLVQLFSLVFRISTLFVCLLDLTGCVHTRQTLSEMAKSRILMPLGQVD